MPNALFSIRLMPGTATLVAQYKNQLVTGPLTGEAHKVLHVSAGRRYTTPGGNWARSARTNPRRSTRRDRPWVWLIRGPRD